MKAKAVLVSVGAALLLASSAQARCNTSCLNHKIAALQTQVKRLTHTVNAENTALTTLSGRLTSLSGTVVGQGSSLNSLSVSLNSLSGEESSLSATVRTLSGTVTTQGQTLACIGELPVTQYGDPAGTFGYSFTADGMTFNTTALDGTASGDPVSAWMVVDSCNTTPTASAAARGILGPEAHIAARATSR